MATHANVVGGYRNQQRYARGAERRRVAGLESAQRRIEEAQGGLSGYREYGQKSLERQERLFNDPSYLEQTGGYKFAMDQGLKGTTASRSSTSIFSGETLKALTEYASGLATQTYDAEWKRLQAGIETGMGAEKQYGDLATTSAEIEAGIGEAHARRYDQYAGALAGEQGFGRQIFGQWSGAFANATASSATSCWVAEVLYGKYANKTLTTRAFVKRHMQDKTPLGAFCRMYSKYGKTWAKWVKKSKILRALAKPIWDKLYKMANEELL